MPTPDENKKIHLAIHQLGLDRQNYEDILMENFGVNSSKGLTAPQTKRLLEILKAKGWQPRPPAKAGKKPFRRSGPTLGRQALLSKIEAHLADRGLPWAYAVGMAKKICKVDAIEFCDSEMLIKIVAALEYSQKRLKRKAAGAPSNEGYDR